MAKLEPTPGVKVNYLIRRRAGVTREQLIAHWFAHHMPEVAERQLAAAGLGRNHASRYFATLFQPRADGTGDWDGIAHLWFRSGIGRPSTPHGTKPTDSFQERAEPYVPWPTREYVIMNGEVATQPLTLNAPFPTTRSGFYKRSFLVAAAKDADVDAMFDHWLTVHVPNVRATLDATGGFRYCVSLATDPQQDTYAGLAELYFADESGWRAYREAIRPDGLEQFVDNDATRSYATTTEMVGIP